VGNERVAYIHQPLNGSKGCADFERERERERERDVLYNDNAVDRLGLYSVGDTRREYEYRTLVE
jgi:hypothetical protein